MTTTYDAIVVGARCAGSPTAMLLARQGYRVLLVDRATFPSDTVSTHLIHAPGVAALRRWGLLDEVIASGCPPVETYSFDFGPITITGTPPPYDGQLAPRTRRAAPCSTRSSSTPPTAPAPRCASASRSTRSSSRTAWSSASAAAAHDGTPVTERAQVVIGADGRNSHVAEAVRPEQLPREAAAAVAATTPTGATCRSTASRPSSGPTAASRRVADQRRADACSSSAGRSPSATRTRPTSRPTTSRPSSSRRSSPSGSGGATREERFAGGCRAELLPQAVRPGLGARRRRRLHEGPDHRQGITDAFRDAEVCAAALDDVFDGWRSFEEAMSAYQRARDETGLPIYGFTTQLATLEPPPPELQQLLGAVHGNQEAMDAFVGVTAGTVSPAEFFATAASAEAAAP